MHLKWLEGRQEYRLSVYTHTFHRETGLVIVVLGKKERGEGGGVVVVLMWRWWWYMIAILRG